MDLRVSRFCIPGRGPSVSPSSVPLVPSLEHKSDPSRSPLRDTKFCFVCWPPRQVPRPSRSNRPTSAYFLKIFPFPSQSLTLGWGWPFFPPSPGATVPTPFSVRLRPLFVPRVSPPARFSPARHCLFEFRSFFHALGSPT